MVAPSVRRRLMAMVYEAFLIVAVLLLAETLVTLATANGHSPLLQAVQKMVLFLVTAAYFIHFWVDSGHTLAMKTWRIQLVSAGHGRVPLRSAALRFLLAWGWFLPALLVCYAGNLKSPRQIGLALMAGVLVWALTAFLHRDRQFLHDRLAGTRLILLPKPAKKPAASPQS